VQTDGAFALPAAFTRYISRYLAEDRPERARSVVFRVAVFPVASAALSALLFVSAGWISQALSGTHTWTQLFQILALTSFYAMLFPQVGGFLQGLQRIREIATISLMNTVVERSAVLYLLYHLPLHMKLYGVVYG